MMTLRPQKEALRRRAPPFRGDILRLYALATARSLDVEAALPKCGVCRGEDGACCWRRGSVIIDRADWPRCPLAMVHDPVWAQVVNIYRASRVSPLTGWPMAYTSWGTRAVIALREEVQREEARQVKAVSSAGKPGGSVVPQRRGPGKRTWKGGR